MATIGGRDEIDALYRNATDGVFTMEADTARRCAEAVQTLIDGLRRVGTKASYPMYVSFGDFDSGQEMQAGFERKMVAMGATLADFIDVAEHLKASFEVAGALVARAEEINAADIGSLDIAGGR